MRIRALHVSAHASTGWSMVVMNEPLMDKAAQMQISFAKLRRSLVTRDLDDGPGAAPKLSLRSSAYAST